MCALVTGFQTCALPIFRFDSNVTPGTPWQFHPERHTQTVTVGARNMAIFGAKNLSDRPVTGTATFNVTPSPAGDRKSVGWGKSVSVRVDHGRGRYIKTKKHNIYTTALDLKKNDE